MKNRMFFYIFAVGFVPAVFCSCAHEISQRDKLTEAEKMCVIERGRKFIIDVKHLNISPDDKVFIKANIPKFYVRYRGYKKGIAKMVWKINPSYSIRITCDGDLLDKECPIRLTISRFQI